ncbi:MAG: hypothetical protein ABJO30_00560 [Hyphomicrobiales bacterium]
MADKRAMRHFPKSIEQLKNPFAKRYRLQQGLVNKKPISVHRFERLFQSNIEVLLLLSSQISAGLIKLGKY